MYRNCVLAAVVCILLAACPPADEGGPVSGNVIEITADITSVTTWESGNVYLIRAWDFYVESTLTIEQGTIIKFHPADGPYMMVGSGGTVIADGTASEPIIFTSYRDDGNGGDTNGDGTATSPAVSDWGYINTNGENGSLFDNCRFLYGGDNSYSSTLSLDAASVATVTNCVFAHNDGNYSGTKYGALDALNAGEGTVIAGNVFYDNECPFGASTSFDIDDSNVFHNPDNISETNTCNGIFVYDAYDPKTALSWAETEVAYVIDDGDFWIYDTLILGNNVVLKFTSGSGMVLDTGVSAISEGTGVAYTSYLDDTRKGDTNGDGSATSSGANDWGGIYDNSLTVPNPHFFTWGNIYYDSH